MRLLGFVVLVFCFLAIGISSRPGAKVPEDLEPVIMVFRTSHMSGCDLLTAIWADGTMLTRSHIDDGQSPLVVARTDADSLRKCLESLQIAGLFGGHDVIYSQPDATTVTITARYDGKNGRLEWTERFNTPVKDSKFIAFMKMWLASRGAVLSIPFDDIKELAASLDKDGLFRGYNPKVPSKTSWFH